MGQTDAEAARRLDDPDGIPSQPSRTSVIRREGAAMPAAYRILGLRHLLGGDPELSSTFSHAKVLIRAARSPITRTCRATAITSLAGSGPGTGDPPHAAGASPLSRIARNGPLSFEKASS